MYESECVSHVIIIPYHLVPNFESQRFFRVHVYPQVFVSLQTASPLELCPSILSQNLRNLPSSIFRILKPGGRIDISDILAKTAYPEHKYHEVLPCYLDASVTLAIRMSMSGGCWIQRSVVFSSL